MKFYVKNEIKEKEENTNYKLYKKQSHAIEINFVQLIYQCQDVRGDARRKAGNDLSFTDATIS